MAAVNQSVTVYEDLKSKIEKGIYSPAESLPEVELSTEYGVSRNTIKKVLLMLARDGLVSIERNKSAKVRSYSMKEVLDFLELRSDLEGFIARKAVPAISGEQIERMERTLAEMKGHFERHELLPYSQRNQQFHQILYDACPNRTAVEVTVNLKSQMSKYNTKTILIPGRDAQSFAEHSAILEAVKRRDAEAAGSLVSRHIDNVRRTFQEHYDLLF